MASVLVQFGGIARMNTENSNLSIRIYDFLSQQNKLVSVISDAETYLFSLSKKAWLQILMLSSPAYWVSMLELERQGWIISSNTLSIHETGKSCMKK